MEWETEGGDINQGIESLSGFGFDTDSGHERMSSAGYLKRILFKAVGRPCVTAFAINCGDQAYGGGGHAFIDFEDLKMAFNNNGNSGNNDILTDTPKCVKNCFDRIRELEINANIFKCADGDRNCKQRNIAALSNSNC